MRSVTIGGVVLKLTDDQVAHLREQLGVERSEDSPDLSMLTTKQAAERLGFSEDYVRDHAAELGGVKLTAGPRAPWRFDPAKLGLSQKNVADSPTVSPRRRAPRRAGTGQLLKARG